MAKQSFLSVVRKEEHKTEFREAFNAFDWNHSGKISYGSLQVSLPDEQMICEIDLVTIAISSAIIALIIIIILCR